ncbi:Miraculin [Bienertia sinuspersici]
MNHFQLITLATTTLLLFTSTTNGASTVLDVFGDPVIAGSEYHIAPYNYDAIGGGFSWKENKRPFTPCPEFYVLQNEKNTDYGQTTVFQPIDGSSNKVTLSTDINIIFPKVSPPAGLPFFCDKSSNVWKVEDNKKVLLGGKKGGKDSNSVFTIKELKTGGYGIFYCTSSSECLGLGIDPKSKDRQLVVNGQQPVPIVFVSNDLFSKKKYATYVASS